MVGSAKCTNVKILDISFYIYTTMCLFGNAQVIFQLKNSEINEVVFVQEKAITFECSFNGSVTTDVMVQIEDPDGRVLVESHQVMPVEYVIQEVTMENRGVYTCRVTYVSVNGRVTLTESLMLNVQDDSLPRCISNGTVGQPYEPGDWLLLSCYCREADICRWSSSVVGVRTGTILTPHDEIEKTGIKKIVRVLVHHTSETDNRTRYDCFRSSSERCAIGPLCNSSKGITYPMGNLSTTEATTEASVLVITRVMISEGSGLGITSEIVDMIGADNNGISVTTSLLIVGAVAIVLILLTIVVVVVICNSRVGKKKTNRRVRDESKAKSVAQSDNGHEMDDGILIYNTVYQGFNVKRKNDVTSCDHATDDNCLYDAPSLTNGTEGRQDGGDYTEIKQPEFHPQPTGELYGENHKGIDRSKLDSPSAGMVVNSKRNRNHDQSETSNVDEERVQPKSLVSYSVLHATGNPSKSETENNQSEAASEVSNEMLVTYATVNKNRNRIN